MQWSADITEHAYITEIKDPARASNNQQYEAQICHYLDRMEKCRRFDLFTSIHQARVDFQSIDNGADRDDIDNPDEYEPVATTASLLNRLKLASRFIDKD